MTSCKQKRIPRTRFIPWTQEIKMILPSAAHSSTTTTTTTTKISGLGLRSHFSSFDCSLSVVLQLDKGDNSENSHVVFCPNKQRYFEPFMCLDQDENFKVKIRDVILFRSPLLLSHPVFINLHAACPVAHTSVCRVRHEKSVVTEKLTTKNRTPTMPRCVSGWL